MANIAKYLSNILGARYGKDVRQSIHDAIQEIDSVADTAQNSATASATAAQKSADAAANASTVAQAAAVTAMESAEDAEEYATQAKETVKKAIGENNISTLGDGTVTGAINAVNDKADTATSIAKGRNQAHVFLTTATMQEWLSNAENKGIYNKGDNLYIVEVDVPDWWIAEVLDEADADTGFYYKIAQLETQKVDLTEILSDIATLESNTDTSSVSIPGYKYVDGVINPVGVRTSTTAKESIGSLAENDAVIKTAVNELRADHYNMSIKVSNNTTNISNLFGWMPFGWELYDTVTGFTPDNNMTVEYSYTGVTPVLFYHNSGLLAIGNCYGLDKICAGAAAGVSMPTNGKFNVQSGSGTVYVYKMVTPSMT